MRNVACRWLIAGTVALVGCGGMPTSDDGGSTGGGAVAGGRTAGGAAGGTVSAGGEAGGSAGGMTAGGTAGGSTAGGIGGSSAGGDAAGGEAGGTSTAGGSTAGGASTAGGSTAGGTSTAGGSSAGGTSTAGGPTAGGTSTAGGSTAGGSTAGGSTAGGSTAGGTSTAGGSTAGGTSTAGGSTAGGTSTAGGSAGGSPCVPTTEVCDGLDNNCNGMIDEGLTLLCRGDQDNDRYETSGAVVPLCPDPARPTFGNCPAGFVSPAASLGLDCNATSATAYRLVSARSDSDGDGACVGPTGQDCVGASLAPGRVVATMCATADDCNDADGTRFRLLALRPDADNDQTCAAGTQMLCVGIVPPAGFRVPSSCMNTFGDDCNDLDPTKFFVGALQPDADGDGYCTAATTNVCTGNTAPAGLRFPASCITQSDCADTNPAIYRMLSVRPDGDNDGYCFGPATNQCSGANPPSGFRLPASCNAADDCRDTNPLANATCLISNGYLTTSATKTCAFVPAVETFTVSTTSICPLGFLLGGFQAVKTVGNGSCTAPTQTSIQMSCNGLDGATCHIAGFCVAQ